MPTPRKGLQSPAYQGTNEKLSYRFDFGQWGTPTNPTVKLYDMSTGKVDVSSAHLSGTAGVSGTSVITPYVMLLTDGITYHLEAEINISGNLLSGYLVIIGEE